MAFFVQNDAAKAGLKGRNLKAQGNALGAVP
jgi:hypothetical protein